jgi:hypothetical protein
MNNREQLEWTFKKIEASLARMQTYRFWIRRIDLLAEMYLTIKQTKN